MSLIGIYNKCVSKCSFFFAQIAFIAQKYYYSLRTHSSVLQSFPFDILTRTDRKQSASINKGKISPLGENLKVLVGSVWSRYKVKNIMCSIVVKCIVCMFHPHRQNIFLLPMMSLFDI